jgi:hypothetical protein
MLFRNGITKERLPLRSIINQLVKSASSLLRLMSYAAGLTKRVDDGVLAWAVVVPYVSAWLVLVVVVS